MTKRVDKRIGNMDEVLETLRTRASKYETNIKKNSKHKSKAQASKSKFTKYPHHKLNFNSNYSSVVFKGTRLPLPQISGRCVSRFHPTDAVLACGSDGQVTIFKGANGFVPFSNWRIQREFKVQNVKEIVSLEWNVSYSNFTEFPSVIFSALLNDV